MWVCLSKLDRIDIENCKLLVKFAGAKCRASLSVRKPPTFKVTQSWRLKLHIKVLKAETTHKCAENWKYTSRSWTLKLHINVLKTETTHQGLEIWIYVKVLKAKTTHEGPEGWHYTSRSWKLNLHKVPESWNYTSRTSRQNPWTVSVEGTQVYSLHLHSL